MTIVLPQSQSGLHGTIEVPGDKSITHRGLMIGALAKGKTSLVNCSIGEDCLTTVNTLRDLGVKVCQNRTEFIVYGKGLKSFKKPKGVLKMNNSGTTARLLLGILAGSAVSANLVGDSSLNKRPMSRVSDPLTLMGAKIITTNGKLPIKVQGRKLHGTRIDLKVASAQVKSAVILAALTADSSTTITEKLPTRNHTEIMLKEFGSNIKTSTDKLQITVEPKPYLIGQNIRIPGDLSSASFFLVAAAITPHSSITIKNVGLNETRTGILKVLHKMNAKIKVTTFLENNEPVGKIEIKSSKLKPIYLSNEDIPFIIDELPLVALLAAHAEGTSIITGAKELRYKEADRIRETVVELQKLGIKIIELEDGWKILGGCEHVVDPILDCHNDHRLGMMLAVAAIGCPTRLLLKNSESVRISYPDFFEDLMGLIG